MWQEERYQRIKALLNTQDRVTIEQIISNLGVSRETVRRDLLNMEEQGLLKRVHGGIIRIEDEAPITERVNSHVVAKRELAKSILPYMHKGITLMLDAGTTNLLVAEELGMLSGITVITNSFDIALKLRNSVTERNSEIILLGGNISLRAPATTGSTTVSDLRRYHADIAILSPVGIDAEKGACNFDFQEADIARTMSEQSNRSFILADQSKIGLTSRAQFCPPEKIDLLITNSKSAECPGYTELANAVKAVKLC
ncbi:DeoR/GlpR family DNA-binding transcription regulator [Leeia sp. TBRC 13508]|uniref:DeoR/GlpR family DNA-binding transcription regulator n=1 Tax=Leeia speluncae TaxID=2884804 RepID=A0ABS8DAR0_9NEIS|nr:DeoR/GlpR family DNA-binding transcription regulator [Leeia speluncae]MCB6185285.1 DeoR/GlpR family DNA-binding transcription regulator [Leeia speluncae]